jgi:hypothetical protein
VQSESESAKESVTFTAMEERKVEAKHDEPKYDEPKQEEVKQQEAKPEEAKQELAQQEEVPEVAAVSALGETGIRLSGCRERRIRGGALRWSGRFACR